MSEKKHPTEAQIKEFWEGCGFKWTGSYSRYWESPDMPSKAFPQLPPVDLNNLFKYAEFKAVIDIGINLKISIDEARKWLFGRWLENIKKGMNYADALFWAIYEVIKA